MAEAFIEDVGQDETIALFGNRDENLRILRDELGLRVISRGGNITLLGSEEQVERGLAVLKQMRDVYREKKEVLVEDVRRFLNQATGGAAVSAPEGKPLEISGPLRRLKVRSGGQSKYVTAIRDHDLTFCIGPAGTGKTYLAVAAALEAFDRHLIKRIVLVRPAVEAGEKLGYLPGDMQAKVHPFLRPLLDALRDMLDFHQVKSYLENDIVEIAPLAYMRGRTLNDAFIILDEGQNTTVPQMRMFLTRMGMGSKVVVTGDVTQVDLPGGTQNGLEDAVARLERLTSVAVVRMQTTDIVRHPLVQAIVNAYESP